MTSKYEDRGCELSKTCLDCSLSLKECLPNQTPLRKDREKRDKLILKLTSLGVANKDIASQVRLSKGTVDHIIQKAKREKR